MMAILDQEVPRIMQRKLSHVIVVDESFEVFSRIWVMAEIAKATPGATWPDKKAP